MADYDPPTWSTYYAGKRDDGGIFSEMFEETTTSIMERTEGHFENPAGFTESVAGYTNGMMILAPGEKGKMHVLHHGFSFLTPEGFQLAFFQGNHKDSSTVKIVNRDELTNQVKVTEGRRSVTTNCPTLDAIIETTNADEFVNLPAGGNDILKGKPNHHILSPSLFLMINGTGTVKAREMASQIIERIRPSEEALEEESEEDREERESATQGMELLLCFLWASEQGSLSPIGLVDAPDSPRVDQLIREAKSKLEPNSPRDERERSPGNFEERGDWGLTSQSLVRELNRMHASREEERTKNEENSSLFKNMGPTQRMLFEALSTTDMKLEPATSEFMKTLLGTKTPQKAIALLKSETRYWEGTFSEGCVHRFLSSGFLSINANRADPGGFTIFMFHPKTVAMSDNKSFDQDNAALREYFGLDVDDETVAFYAKQGYFHPTNVHDLRIQLQTALNFLELVTCKNSIVTVGLAHILDVPRWVANTTLFHDRFQTEKEFGSKFIYSIDRTLQIFFDKIVTSWRTVSELGDPRFLMRKANDLLDTVEEGMTLNITLPRILTDPQVIKEPPTKKAKAGTGTKATPTKTEEAPKVAKKSLSIVHPKEPDENPEVCEEWKIPASVDFLSLFKDRTPASKNWPKFADRRLGSRNKKTKVAPLCVRYQMTGKCTQGCKLAHILRASMTEEQAATVDTLMAEVKTENSSKL
jgi:hypothetical protein